MMVDSGLLLEALVALNVVAFVLWGLSARFRLVLPGGRRRTQTQNVAQPGPAPAPRPDAVSDRGGEARLAENLQRWRQLQKPARMRKTARQAGGRLAS